MGTCSFPLPVAEQNLLNGLGCEVTWQMSISTPGPFFHPVNIYTLSLDLRAPRGKKIMSRSGEQGRRGFLMEGTAPPHCWLEADASGRTPSPCPPLAWRCAEARLLFCPSPSWIPLEDLTHSQRTSNPGIQSIPFISTHSSASSVLSCGCKRQRHFLFQVVLSRKPGSVG